MSAVDHSPRVADMPTYVSTSNRSALVTAIHVGFHQHRSSTLEMLGDPKLRQRVIKRLAARRICVSITFNCGHDRRRAARRQRKHTRWPLLGLIDRGTTQPSRDEPNCCLLETLTIRERVLSMRASHAGTGLIAYSIAIGWLGVRAKSIEIRVQKWQPRYIAHTEIAFRKASLASGRLPIRR